MTGVQDPETSRTAGALTALRNTHERALLARLAEAPEGLTQDALQASSGLARSSVSVLMKRLGGVLESRRDLETVTGRPAQIYSIVADLGVVVGVDVGLTSVYTWLAGLDGKPLSAAPLVDTLRSRSPRDVPELVLDLLVRTIDGELTERGYARDQVAAIGVSLPGPIDRATGRLLDDSMAAWSGTDVADQIARRLELPPEAPVVLEKDAIAALLAEQRWGAARGTNDVLYVDWSSAISTSAALDGRVWRGTSGVAGELGHLKLPLSAGERSALRLGDLPVRECPRCGRQGCVEQVVGGLRFADVWGFRTPEEAIAAMDADREVRKFAEAAARVIGRAIGVYVTLLNPRDVLVRGDMPAVLEPLLKEGLTHTAFPRAREAMTLNMTSELGSWASLRGAVAAGMDAGLIPYLMAKANQIG